MDAVYRNIMTALSLLLSMGIYCTVAQDSDTKDDDDDDEDDAMLIFAYVAFAVGGVMIIIAVILLVVWWKKTRKRRQKQRYLSKNFQAYNTDPWLKNSTDSTHRVQTQVEQDDDDGSFTNLDVHTFEGHTGETNTDSLRPVARSVNATPANRMAASAHPLPVTLIDAVSSEESSATHTSTSPIISPKSRAPEPAPDYDRMSPVHYTSSSGIPRIVAGLEPEPESTYSRRMRRSANSMHAESVTTSEVLAALDAATAGEDTATAAERAAPSDFAVDGVFLNANSLERSVYNRRRPLSSSSTLNSAHARPHSEYAAYGDEALPGDREVMYNVTLTVS